MSADCIERCKLLGEGSCSQQKEMEKVYLFPQIMEPQQVEKYHSICQACWSSTGHEKRCPSISTSGVAGSGRIQPCDCSAYVEEE